MIEQDGRVHPRPQLARERYVDLGGVWDFAYDDAGRGLDEGWQTGAGAFDRTIVVPFPPESPASGIGDTTFHPVVWYRRHFADSRQDREERLLLHCGAVDYRASVWVNGQLVASHEGGHTPFSADITTALRPDGRQELVIRAEDPPADLAQPRGKQDWQAEPHKIWYHRTTGIWQPIWLEPVGATRVTRLRWTPDLDRGLLGLGIRLQRQDAAPLRVRLQLRLRDTLLVDDSYTVQGSDLHREITLDAASNSMDRSELLWSPSHPNLIDATIEVWSGQVLLDRVQSYVGLRSAAVAEGRFLLNGFPYYLRLAGPGAGLLAAVAPGGTGRGSAAAGGRAGQGARLQRGTHTPEG